MATSSIFVNLPVADLEASTAFYTALGYAVNPLFSNENAACIVMSEHIYVMLLTTPFFQTFTDKSLIDAKTNIQVLNAIDVESREAVDEWAEKALAAGGSEAKPARDLGFMYSRDIEDPDGHIWEAFWMDPAASENGPPAS
ncbi:glyoxalase [Salinibacterium sp. G-O1]|uniref:VOC family protein n=1 Tax=Salinibacterium sp. G-O1 TaxID=3046208 RepID=UPI0024BA38A6|nr:glyoxalase [Salinibacterium sp. G-O1]MDJ0333621.1 glyoxalase [Salinibacterium sp. G-O1]